MSGLQSINRKHVDKNHYYTTITGWRHDISSVHTSPKTGAVTVKMCKCTCVNIACFLSAFQICCTYCTYTAQSVYFENSPATSLFFNLLSSVSTCKWVCVCVWHHNHHLHALSSQMSVVSNLLSMSTSPLLYVLLFCCCPLAFCCTVAKWLFSFCSEGTVAGCSRLMVARLVSVMEELVW